MYEDKSSYRIRPPNVKIPTLYEKNTETFVVGVDNCTTNIGCDHHHHHHHHHDDNKGNKLCLSEGNEASHITRFNNRAFTTKNRTTGNFDKGKVNTCETLSGDNNVRNEKKELEVVECTPWTTCIKAEPSWNSFYYNVQENKQLKETIEKEKLSVWEDVYNGNETATIDGKSGAVFANSINHEGNKIMNKANCSEVCFDAKFVDDQIEDKIIQQFRERCNELTGHKTYDQQTLPAQSETEYNILSVIKERAELSREASPESLHLPLQSPLLRSYTCATTSLSPERSRSPPPRTLRSECKPFICFFVHSTDTSDTCKSNNSNNISCNKNDNMYLLHKKQNTEILPRSRSPSPQFISTIRNVLSKDASENFDTAIDKLHPPSESSISTLEMHRNKRRTKSESCAHITRNQSTRNNFAKAVHVWNSKNETFCKTPSELENTCIATKERKEISSRRSLSSNSTLNRPRWNQYIPRKFTIEHGLKNSFIADDKMTSRPKDRIVQPSKTVTCNQDVCKGNKMLHNENTRSMTWQDNWEMLEKSENKIVESSNDLSLAEQQNIIENNGEQQGKIKLIERQLFSDNVNTEHMPTQEKTIEECEQCRKNKQECYSERLTAQLPKPVQLPQAIKMLNKDTQRNHEQRQLWEYELEKEEKYEEKEQWELFVQEEQVKHLEHLCTRIEKMLHDVMRDCTITQEDAQIRQSIIEEHMRHMFECVKLIVMQRARYHCNQRKVHSLVTVHDTEKHEEWGSNTLFNSNEEEMAYHDKYKTCDKCHLECKDASSCNYESSIDNGITPSPIASTAKSNKCYFDNKFNNNIASLDTGNSSVLTLVKNGQLIASTPLRPPPNLPINLHRRANSLNEKLLEQSISSLTTPENKK